MVSDHFHPWTDSQGQSPFVWSVIGGVAATTERIRLGTGVTCPTIRIHPAIIAQAAATASAMMPGRFFLGIGSGENLNEHILGDRWPSVSVRQEMMVEAVDVIQTLWEGGYQSYDGDYYTVENARIYTLPDELPEIMIAASGPQAAEIAGQLGDALCMTSPDQEVLDAFDQAGGEGKPRYIQLTVCWAEREEEARRTALEIWPNAAMPGQLSQELPLPLHFEQTAQLITEEMIAEAIVCGPDVKRHADAVQELIDAGFDHIYIHQVGHDQAGFMQFYTSKVLPNFREVAANR
jgi:G6PDH family F420-dependent oxidoreductase